LSLSEWDSLAEFPVSFTVELVSFNKNIAVAFRCLEKDQVGRDSLPLIDLDDLAHLNIFGGNRNVALRTRPKSVQRVIYVFVSAEPVEVVKAFLDHRHT
jgi:hypothetical protein